MSSCATCGRGKKHFGLIDLPSEIKFLWRVARNACISTYLLRTHFRYTATSYPIYLLSVVTHTVFSIAMAKPDNVLVLNWQHQTFSSIVCVWLPFPFYVLQQFWQNLSQRSIIFSIPHFMIGGF